MVTRTAPAAAGLPLDLGEDPLVAAPADGAGPAERSDVVAARADVDAAQAAKREAVAAALPPVDVGVWSQWHVVGAADGVDEPIVPSWTPGNAAVSVEPQVSLDRPLWHRNEACRSEASAEAAVAERPVAVVAATAAEQGLADARRAVVEQVLDVLPSVTADDATEAVAAVERPSRAGVERGHRRRRAAADRRSDNRRARDVVAAGADGLAAVFAMRKARGSRLEWPWGANCGRASRGAPARSTSPRPVVDL